MNREIPKDALSRASIGTMLRTQGEILRSFLWLLVFAVACVVALALWWFVASLKGVVGASVRINGENLLPWFGRVPKAAFIEAHAYIGRRLADIRQHQES